MMIEKAGIVCTPGSGFGKSGEGYIRLSIANSIDNIEKALERIRRWTGERL